MHFWVSEFYDKRQPWYKVHSKALLETKMSATIMYPAIKALKKCQQWTMSNSQNYDMSFK